MNKDPSPCSHGGIQMEKSIIRNNVISVVVHIVLCVLTFAIYRISWATNKSSSVLIQFWTTVLLAIVNPLLYYLCGRNLMHDTYNKKDNIRSVAGLTAVILLCLYCPIGPRDVSNIALAPLASLLFHSNALGTFLFALLPSLFLFLGMLMQKRNGVRSLLNAHSRDSKRRSDS